MSGDGPGRWPRRRAKSLRWRKRVAIASQIDALGKLPRRDETWELGFVSLPGGRGPALCPVCASEDAASLGEPVSLEELLADPGCADRLLMQALAKLALGDASLARSGVNEPLRYLPSVIRTVPGKGAGADLLRESIERLGVRLEHAKELEVVDEVGAEIVAEVMEHMLDGDDDEPLDIPPLKNVKGLEPARLRSFAEAAADYWRAAPWELGPEDEIAWRMEPAPPALNLPVCAPMGMLGQEIGVGFFFSREEMVRVAESVERGGKLRIPRTLWSVTFEPGSRLPAPDVKLWESVMLPLASPEAYPVPSGISPRKTPLRPTPVILTEMELVLRALTRLTKADVECGEASGEFKIFGGTRRLRLVRVTNEDEAPLRLGR